LTEPTPSDERPRRRSQSKAPARDGDAVERILLAAERCFRDAGYTAVTVREIAAQADVSKSLVLYHFESKDHVFAELQLRIYRRLAENVKAAVAGSTGTTAERALVALDALMQTVREGNDLAAHAMLGALASPSVVPHVRRMRRELKTLLHRTMEDIFADEADRLPLPLARAGDLLWAALTGLGLQAVVDDSPEELERGFESLRTIVSLAFASEGVGR
jgi:AcrR family transcriptional regulator